MSNGVVQPLSTYQRGALAFLSIRKKAKTNPAMTPLLDPEVFIQSSSWHFMKVQRKYRQADIREFLRGFYDASQVKAGQKDHLA